MKLLTKLTTATKHMIIFLPLVHRSRTLGLPHKCDLMAVLGLGCQEFPLWAEGDKRLS